MDEDGNKLFVFYFSPFGDYFSLLHILFMVLIYAAATRYVANHWEEYLLI